MLPAPSQGDRSTRRRLEWVPPSILSVLPTSQHLVNESSCEDSGGGEKVSEWTAASSTVALDQNSKRKQVNRLVRPRRPRPPPSLMNDAIFWACDPPQPPPPLTIPHCKIISGITQRFQSPSQSDELSSPGSCGRLIAGSHAKLNVKPATSRREKWRFYDLAILFWSCTNKKNYTLTSGFAINFLKCKQQSVIWIK